MKGWQRWREFGPSLLVLVAALSSAIVFQIYDAYSPEAYRLKQVRIARSESELIVYNTVHDDVTLTDILDAFRKRYPFIAVHDSDSDAEQTYERFVREISHHRASADVVWTLAMDLQEKLINDGFAEAYTSPQLHYLPSWAHWQNLGYGLTVEPIAIVYNKRFVPNSDIAASHASLLEMLRKSPERYRGRVAIYNPEQSAVGMQFLSQDVRATPDSWASFNVFGALHAHLYNTSRDILAHVLSGDQWIGYDVIASFALQLQKTHPELAIVYPSDYVLTFSRVGFISAFAKHPNAARLFIDFLLSEQGQEILRSHSIGSVRQDIAAPQGQPRLDPERTQAIRIGPGLLSDLDRLVRAQFLRHWDAAFAQPTPTEIQND